MLRKIISSIIGCLLLAAISFGQKDTGFQDSVAAYFKELKASCQQFNSLWGKDLYGPVLLVDPASRHLYANYPDTAGVLSRSGSVFTGILPNEINIANTALDWNGRRWAMVILPLPNGKHDRVNLLTHELFHVAQPSLGLSVLNVDNNHLDQKSGRIYLRLELAALKKAVQSSRQQRKKHIANALLFRKYRHSLYPAADSTENQLELNEGLAEYTGITMSGRSKKEYATHFGHSIDMFYKNPTFVRSFAYQTTPVYGYMLRQSKSDWNKEINLNTNLTTYFIKAFDIKTPPNLQALVKDIAIQYGGDIIINEEEEREEKTKQVIAFYKQKFIEQPHLELFFENMNVSFNPGNIVPLEDKGTVYPNMRITDNWGILTVENGALMSPFWDKLSVASPNNKEGKNIKGDGYTLELNEGYELKKDEATGNYLLAKK